MEQQVIIYKTNLPRSRLTPFLCFHHEHYINTRMWIYKQIVIVAPQSTHSNQLNLFTLETNKECVYLRRSKTGNISADELFSMTQYLGRLYDHDPDNIKKIEKLHSILLANNPDYDVDSTMRSVCLITKYPPYFVLIFSFSNLSFNFNFSSS
jgi:hypothetical protein